MPLPYPGCSYLSWLVNELTMSPSTHPVKPLLRSEVPLCLICTTGFTWTYFAGTAFCLTAFSAQQEKLEESTKSY